MKYIPTGTIMPMKVNYTLSKEDNFMRNQYKFGVCFLVVTSLFSCGGGGSSDNSQQQELTPPPENVAPITQPKPILTAADIVADPNATFKTSKKVDYSAYNESDIDITLFVINSDGDKLARYHIKAGEFADISVQLDSAAVEIGMRWHQLEHVKKEYALITELSNVYFTGF